MPSGKSLQIIQAVAMKMTTLLLRGAVLPTLPSLPGMLRTAD